MFWLNWLKRWCGARGKKSGVYYGSRFRPILQMLEDRLNPVSFGYAFGLGGLGATGSDVARAITTDAAGNVFITGNFSNTVDFDPGPGTVNLPNNGAADIFIAKYNVTGSLLWARSIGGTGSDYGYGIAVDTGGNVYTTGSFFTSAGINRVDFDPGAGTTFLSSAGVEDIFISKLDSSGNFVSAGRIGGGNTDVGKGIAVDSSGNVFITGNFRNTVDFDPGPGTLILTANGTLDDLFIAKVDPSGNAVWANRTGGPNNDDGTAIALDSSANVYTTGFFNGTNIDFDPGPGSAILTSVNVEDIFISKFDSNGAFGWANSMGGTSPDQGFGIAVDAASNVYTTGFFQRTVDFDPGPGTSNLNSAGNSQDIFVSKLDTNGIFVWASGMGGSNLDQGLGIALDVAGNVYTTGAFQGTSDFDPGAGISNLSSDGSSLDIFVSKLDSAGNYVWAGRMGGTSADYGRGIALDTAGSIYTTGSFIATADFDPGPGTFPLNSIAASDDIFLSQLTQTPVTIVQSLGTTDVSEVGATDTYIVVLDQLPTANVFVTQTPDAQVTVAPTVLTFTPFNWNVVQTVTVTAVDDALTEGLHTGVISIATSSADLVYNARAIPSLTANITDNDQSGVTITQSGGSTDVAEGGPTDTYTIVLNSRPTSAVMINLAPGSQLTVSPTSLLFNPANWNIVQTVTVTAVDDLAIESPSQQGVISHTVTSTDTNYNLFAIPNITANITDNDFAPGVTLVQSGGTTSLTEGGPSDTYTIALTTAPTANVVITLAPNSQVSVSSTTFTFNAANYNVAQTVTVTAVDDAIASGTHSGVVSHTASSTDTNYGGITIASVTASILDNDGGGVTITPTGISTDVSEAGTTDRYTVVLIQAPISNVVVSFTGDSQVSASPTTLTFTPANWSTPRTVVVTAIDDGIYEGSHVGLVQHTLTTTDPAYSSLLVADVLVNVVDNDPQPGVALSATSVAVSEAGAVRTYTIKLLSQPTDTVTVDLFPDSQVNVAPANFVFTPANWNTPRTVTVSAINDSIFEGPHTGIISGSTTSLDPVYDALAVDVTANITDNDLQPGVTLSPTGPFTLVEGSSAVYTMVLNSPPSTDVTVSLLPDSQLLVNPAEEVFTRANWNIPHTVTLGVLDDIDVNGFHSGLISHSVSSADSNYDFLPVDDVSVSILDNDGSIIAGTSGNDKILVTYSTGQDKVVINVNGKTTYLPLSTSQIVVQAGLGNDSIQVTEPPFPVVILGGAGKDTVTILGRQTSNEFVLAPSAVTLNFVDVTLWDSESLILTGKKSNDSLAVTAIPTFPVEFKGDLGTDLVTGPEQFNTWNITALGAGTLNKTIKLTAIESLTGGTESDAFWFSAGKGVAGFVDGGGGYDILDYSLYSTPAVVNLQTSTATGTGGFANIVKFRGGKGSDKLIAADQSNLWNITATNFGDVNGTMAFENVENLSGGNQDDTFALANLAGVKGKLDGGLGVDILSYSAYLTLGVTVNLQTKTATSTGGWLNLDQFDGGGSGADILIGANRQNLWNLAARDAGDVNGSLFSAFENLTGGTGFDTFNLGTFGFWTGTLNGGSGSDTLFAATAVNNIYLVPAGSTSGTLNGRRFVGVEKRL